MADAAAARDAAQDAACFVQGQDALADLLATWRAALGAAPAQAIVVAEPGSALATAWRRWPARPAQATLLAPRAAGLLDKPFSMARIQGRLLEPLAAAPAAPSAGGATGTVLLVDMDWLLQAPSAMANGAIWGTIIDRLLAGGVRACLSLYHRRHLPERDLLAGLHAHAGVVAADGCQANPYQLPAELALHTGSAQVARQRLDHWLARLSPTLRARQADAVAGGAGPLSGGESSPALHGERDEAEADAEAADPAAAAGARRWKLRCFGSLRVYRADGTAIDWHGAARAAGRTGSTRKVRGLFAMLLLAGDRGLSAPELIEVLWPGADAPDKALNRLHHTVNELRRLLLEPDAPAAAKAREHPHLTRQDQRYVLRPPPNSWIDVEEFPQLCRQGGDLLREGRPAEALLCFESALKLYTGDLFADLPASLTEGSDADWCASTRGWLRELYFKVHGDCARIQREQGRLLAAAAHCQQLLRHDPVSPIAHGELMRIHAAQGRREALDRQFQRYRQALVAGGHPKAAPIPLMDLYVGLMRTLATRDGTVQTPSAEAR